MVGALDLGTSSIRFMLFDAAGAPVASAQHEFTQHMPPEGWVEHDAADIGDGALRCMAECIAASPGSTVAAVGVTNQRETLVCWSAATGAPLCRAIVWMDTRTQGVVDALVAEHGGDADALRGRCGLPFATCGAALGWRVFRLGADVNRHAKGASTYAGAGGSKSAPLRPRGPPTRSRGHGRGRLDGQQRSCHQDWQAVSNRTLGRGWRCPLSSAAIRDPGA